MKTSLVGNVASLMIVALCAGFTHAQSANGVLAPVRSIDWSTAGVEGGIPHRTTIYSTLNPGVTVDQINQAISSCPNGQVVS